MKTSMYLTIIREYAAKNPGALAVITKSNAITYGELVGRVDALAGDLLKRKLSPETPVAVCSGKSIDWVVGLLAVLGAGGIYIPVDPMLPMQRKLQILKDSAVWLILAESAFVALFPDSAPVIALHDRIQTSGPGTMAPQIVADQYAYGIYSSGATGDPQSVLISHGNIDACAIALRDKLQLTTDDRYLHSAPISLSAAMWQLIVPLISGAASVIASREEAGDVEMLITRMVQSGVTVFDTVPSYLSRWLETVSNVPHDGRDQLKSKLRRVLTTGEALPAQTANRLRKLFPAVQMWNLYGQAETTGTIAAYEVGKTVGDPVPIGRPLGESQLYVLDDNLKPSSEGELYVAGPCLAQEYPGRVDLTASRFIPNPFSSEHGSRMYRTGDRARQIDSGNLTFLGRTDDLVRIHGTRIDLGEIDALLKTHDDVLDAATVLRSVGRGDPCLVSFVVARTGQPSPRTEQLRDHLARLVVEVAVPSYFVCVTDIPREPSGRISRPALSRCDLNLEERQMSGESPRTAAERMVASAWEELLNVTSVGLKDDFFALGGNSMQAIVMTSQLQKQLSTRLPLARYFFQNPTLEAFAGAIAANLTAQGAPETQVRSSELAVAPTRVASEPEL